MVTVHSDSQSQGAYGSGLSAPKSKKGKRMSKWKEEYKSKRGPYIATLVALISHTAPPSDSLMWVGWERGVLLNEAKSCQIVLPVLQNYVGKSEKEVFSMKL